MAQQPSSPHPWFAPIIASAAFIIGCILWPYIQMRHWKDPGVDYLYIAGNIAMFILAWGLLGWAVIANFRDARRAKALRVDIETVQSEAIESRAKQLAVFERQKHDIEDGFKRDSEQALAILNLEWSSKYGTMLADCEKKIEFADSLLAKANREHDVAIQRLTAHANALEGEVSMLRSRLQGEE